MKILELEARVG
jgi:hypothetical protein